MLSSRTILIAGVGNVLLSDDGVGVHAVRELEKHFLPGVTVAEIGTAILHGLSFVESAERVLVIDAARGGHPPGTIYQFEADDSVVRPAASSIHAVGLREAMRMLPAGTRRPPLTVIGVEPQSLDYGMELSPPVRAALPQVVELAHSLVNDWCRRGQLHCAAEVNAAPALAGG